ncbi:hypothetical protein M408DRAFT_332490 [Serendipita vermifera MAFF 305830]|uniref:MFS general substrate transporter n=1 Tax=Serendipita vermifera MAFF 305830 TaxID=933852 RepID=A0A0C2X135_SERVB|nr:hypothetical protein M408DRAFT_332490 [Serendipita vermifera MAFF 305830]
MVGFGGISTGAEDTGRRWKGRKYVKGSKWARMPLLTIGLLGVQIIWSTEMGYASPYLLSLGLSKSLMSIVFVAGPLSGLFVQPLIGVLADSSTSRFGRRRPYIIVGSILCALAMLLLGFTKDVASWFLDRDSPANANLTIWLAVFAIYCIDFSINAVQAADRALLVDTLPTSQQERGNAWAGRMLSVGSVVGFFVGNLPLPTVFPFLGRTHLQVLCVITSFLLILAHIVTCFTVEERILLADDHSSADEENDGTSLTSESRRRTSGGGWRHFPAPRNSSSSSGGGKWRPRISNNPAIKIFTDIYANVRTLPPVIRQICMVQFFSWIGWFPVLFFSTVWVGEIYTLAVADAAGEAPVVVASADGTTPTTTEEATLVGFTALLYSSLLGLATIILLPLIVAFFQRRAKRHAHGAAGTRRGVRFHIGLAEIWTFSLFMFGLCMFATWFTQDSVDSSVVVIGLTGFCFAVSQWVPFSLLAEEILGGNRDSASGNGYAPVGAEAPEEEAIPLRQGAVRLEEGGQGEETPLSRGVVFESGEHEDPAADERTLVDGRGGDEDQERLMRDLENSEFAAESPHSSSHQRSGSASGSGGIGEKAGIILGIHNVAIVIPQFLVTGLSSIIFAFFESGVSGVHPGAGHAGAGVGGVVDGPTGVAALDPTDIEADPDIGFDEKGGDVVRMLTRKIARRAAQMVGRELRRRAEEAGSGSPDGIGLIFRIGGVSSFIACYLCWKLARDLRRRG